MYARPIPLQTKMHYKNVQILAVAYNIGGFNLCFRHCLNGSGGFHLFKQILET